MIKEIEKVVTPFRSCFTREAAFDWFVVVVLGLMIRVDHQGVSAIIRWLFLDPIHYKALTWFFRARSWQLEDVTQQWCTAVVQRFPLVRINGRVILSGDGIKVAKQAEKMPAVKRLHQEENLANKPEYILGHHHGVVGVLAHRAVKLECVPVAAALQEGIAAIRVLQGHEAAAMASPSGKSPRRTLVTRMADLVGGVATALGLPSYAVLDAFFAAGPLFKVLGELVDDRQQRQVHVIVRGKKSAVGYKDLPPIVSPRPKGRPRKYGERVKLWELLETAAASFVECTIPMYGGVHAVKYLCVDLLWRPVQTKVRFVLVQDDDAPYLLMSSDLTLTPEMIIWLYATRFKIEVTLKMLKNLIGGFFYHFWTHAWPALPVTGTADLTAIPPASPRAIGIGSATDAIERFVTLACIALGLLQYLTLVFPDRLWRQYAGWLRTYTSPVPSPAVAQAVVRQTVFQNFRTFKSGLIYRITQAKRRTPAADLREDAA